MPRIKGFVHACSTTGRSGRTGRQIPDREADRYESVIATWKRQQRQFRDRILTLRSRIKQAEKAVTLLNFRKQQVALTKEINRADLTDIEADLRTQEEVLGTLASDAPGFDLDDF